MILEVIIDKSKNFQNRSFIEEKRINSSQQ